MEPKEILKSMNTDMKKSVDHTLHEFSSLHTGKASPAMLDGIRVQAYGSTVSMKEVAAVTTPDAKTIMVQPWDKSVIRDIEKAIQEANIGLNPLVDGGILRVPVPELTGQRRQELAKTAGSMAEDGRVRIRQNRRDALDLLKAAKDDGLPEDDFKRYEKDVQKAHDDFIAEINQHLTHKEAELKKV
ncbi:MAG: ribosome recycling factor [Opitutales bacterium]|jgi:ribosome recycling factor|nr:ribosome recycling factor [Opitutales bacterium]MDP4643760.1 ribosome recycling factor [Opitutales bacterium]MDP4777162.1 ribosome recycling factor [Opitutales bacterium]MDP4883934.1 ribosome recycling factor [Opitutales bacterium]MDP5080316.1 ribosome recycling factor [Opitutales bacterium]